MSSPLGKSLLGSLLFLGLVSLAIGQTCPQGQVGLAITPANPVAGTAIQITITGTPGAAITLFNGANPGQTTLSGPGPLNGTVICLNAPFRHHHLGQVPPSGTKTVPFPTPPGIPAGGTREYQVVTVSPGPTVDTSNTVTLTFAAPPLCVPGNAVLSVLPDVPAQPGDTITVDVTATVGSFVMLARSPHAGSTPLPFPNLTLCLGMPYHLRLMGVIPTTGTLTETHSIPTNATLPGNATIHFQAVVISISGGNLTIDTSNTDTLLL